MDGTTPVGFKYALGQSVVIMVSGQAGKVIGRSEYANGAQPSYLLRYADSIGAKEDWWTQDALTENIPMPDGVEELQKQARAQAAQ